jgi:hypothetical protein
MNTVLTTRNGQVRGSIPRGGAIDLAGATFQVSPIDGGLTITFVMSPSRAAATHKLWSMRCPYRSMVMAADACPGTLERPFGSYL